MPLDSCAAHPRKVRHGEAGATSPRIAVFRSEHIEIVIGRAEIVARDARRCPIGEVKESAPDQKFPAAGDYDLRTALASVGF